MPTAFHWSSMLSRLRLGFTSACKTRTARVIINASWASAATPIKLGLGIVQTGLLARMLGPDGIGVMVLLHAVCGTFESVLKIDSAEAIIVYFTKALANSDKKGACRVVIFCYTLDFISSLVAFAGVIACSLFLPRLLNLPTDQQWLQSILGLTLLFQSTYWTSHALLRVANRFSWTFLQAATHSIIKTIAVGLLFINGAGLPEVVWLQVGLSLIDGLAMLLMAHIALRARGYDLTAESLASSWRMPREVWRFQLLGHGRRILKSMNRYVDTLMIGYIGNPMQAGLYRAGKQITEQMQMPIQGLSVSLYPEYTQLYFNGDMPSLRRLVKRFSVLFTTIGLFVGVILWFGAEWVIKIVLGNEFLPAKDLVRILMISSLTLIVMAPVYALPAATGRGGPALLSIAAALSIQAIAIVWLVPQQGALGAAWANLAYIVTWALVLTPYIVTVLRTQSLQPPDRASEASGIAVEGDTV